MVIDAAEYHPVSSIKRVQFCQVTSSSMPTNKAAAPYLISDPIPEASADELVKIKSVSFRTYRASYTWFEARILRREPGDCVIPEWQNDMTAPTRIVPDPETEAPRFRRHGWAFVEHNGRQGWKIQHNVTARPHYRVHEVEWNVNKPMDPIEGTGDGDGFVETLKPGDRIAVYARAMFPGWANHVAEFQIDVRYSI
ncbi:hypothetical protein K490DRAFT_65464 [Saccharata proteae CBS 121410]|uniref:Uncharacterized protein n=1 Tax=Saccharata proteae CBS 121410 TaxID=1314787 RepID=A0A9P4HX41_9PEZI|nr:hypothetical protein K490DRAFT_65464 [Saccharata proteae CBS 121410]